MISKFSFVVAALLPFAAFAQDLGPTPVPSLHARDVYLEHKLPPLKNGPDDALASAASELGVTSRANQLGLTEAAPVEAWGAAETLYREMLASAARPVMSGGGVTAAKASELNRILADPSVSFVRLAGPRLEMDEPIRIQRGDLTVDLAGSELTPAGASPYLVRIEQARNVVLTGGRFGGGDSAILVARSEEVVIRDNEISGLDGNGIVVTASRRVAVWENSISGLGRAPVVVHADTVESVVARNEITGNVGSSNWHAGILVTDRHDADLAADPKSILTSDGYWAVPMLLRERTKPPRNNVIAYNRIAMNRSSGIYVDGGVQTVIVSNLIEGNSKEGLCLDNGATANVVAFNTVHQNGRRWGKSDDELAKDFVLGLGRLPDGTAVAKVPGISIDNAAYNIVFSNAVTLNYGGGIKMVRTAYFNMIGLNTILDNNEGASEKAHFFGIELGAAVADAPSEELDFTPSRGNIIFTNIIQGNHYAGIFFGDGSDLNDVFDNVIFGAKTWAMESVKAQRNSSLNNLTNLPSRNINAGIDPALIGITTGRFD